MARITVEDCLKKVGGRFELVILAAGRAKRLLAGAKPVVDADNREVVTALREVADGKVYFVEPEAKESESSDESTAQPEGEKAKKVEKTKG
jgi:DNA-directed RNA polymerase subunit omega